MGLLRYGLLLGAFTLTIAPLLQAQTESGVVEEIVVTATRREEGIQSVPIAVTAVTGEELQSRGVLDTESLNLAAPSLFITSSQQVGLGAQLRIRGIGTATGNVGFEGSVGVFIDGVYLARSNIAFNDLLDVERVEVLRGPQGTLFGKNTSAGSINILTRKPSDSFEAETLAAASNRDGYRLNAYASGALSENLSASIAGQINKRDGYIDDIVSGETYQDTDRFLARGQLLWEAADSASLRLIADISGRDERSSVAIIDEYGALGGAIAAAGGTILDSSASDDLETTLDGRPRGETDEYGFTAILDALVRDVDLRVIAGHRRNDSDQVIDSDYVDIDFSTTFREIEDEFTSLEAQVSGRAGRVDWLAGAYWFDRRVELQDSLLQGNDMGAFYSFLTGGALSPAFWAPGAGMLLQDTEQDNDGYSFFTHNQIHLSQDLSLTLGVRYLHEEKTGGSTFDYAASPSCALPAAISGICPTPDYADDYSDDEVTYTAALQYEFDDNLMAYGSYARGFKAGGLNLNRQAGGTQGVIFDPETVDAYELGLKSRFPASKLTANVAGFWEKFDDFQLNTFTGEQFVVTNEGSVESYGVEVELAWSPLDWLVVNAGAMYNIAEYGNDVNDPALANNQVSNAPKWSGTYGVTVERALSDSNYILKGTLNGRSQSKIRTASNLAQASEQDAYTVLNARLALASGRETWEAGLFARNLTDERYRTIAFSIGGGAYESFYAESRLYGAELLVRF